LDQKTGGGAGNPQKNRGFPDRPDVNRSVARTLPEEDVLRVYRETVGSLYAYVSRRVGGDRALAEDLVQETWMRALDAWPKRGMPEEPAAWLTHVARNTLVSHFRRRRPESVDPATIDIEDDRFSPASPDAASVVGWGLSRLRRAHADVLEAFYFDGQSVSQIAAARRVSERAIEGRLRRARAKLKKQLSRIMRPARVSQPGAVKEGTHDARQTRTP
jgi:RNA polymerase sigma-70 factor (ECF subfamily)